MDKVDKETRSRTMRAIKSRGNLSTEKRLRAKLVAAGCRGWKMHDINLPGTPDFVFVKERVAIFVDGCFWHGCSTCYRRPHSSRKYWDKKLRMNIARDKRTRRQLRKHGWSVLRVWEHSLLTASANKVIDKINAVLKQKRLKMSFKDM